MDMMGAILDEHAGIGPFSSKAFSTVWRVLAQTSNQQSTKKETR
jgi:hypothetical protein